jgi:hypothetical protein
MFLGSRLVGSDVCSFSGTTEVVPFYKTLLAGVLHQAGTTEVVPLLQGVSGGVFLQPVKGYPVTKLS